MIPDVFLIPFLAILVVAFFALGTLLLGHTKEPTSPWKKRR